MPTHFDLEKRLRDGLNPIEEKLFTEIFTVRNDRELDDIIHDRLNRKKELRNYPPETLETFAEILESSSRFFPNNTAILFYLHHVDQELYNRTEDVKFEERSRIDIDRILEKLPDLGWGYEFLGYYYAKREQIKEAIQNFEIAVKKPRRQSISGFSEIITNRTNRGISERFVKLAELYYCWTDIPIKDQIAIEYVYQAIKEDPTNPNAWTTLGVVFFEQKDYEKSTYYCKRGLEFDPTNRLAIGVLANIAIAKGRLEEAEGLFSQLFDPPSGCEDIGYYGLCRISMSKNLWINALKYHFLFEKSQTNLRSGQWRPGAPSLLFQISEKMGGITNVINHLESILEHEFDYSVASFLLPLYDMIEEYDKEKAQNKREDVELRIFKFLQRVPSIRDKISQVAEGHEVYALLESPVLDRRYILKAAAGNTINDLKRQEEELTFIDEAIAVSEPINISEQRKKIVKVSKIVRSFENRGIRYSIFRRSKNSSFEEYVLKFRKIGVFSISDYEVMVAKEIGAPVEPGKFFLLDILGKENYIAKSLASLNIIGSKSLKSGNNPLNIPHLIYVSPELHSGELVRRFVDRLGWNEHAEPLLKGLHGLEERLTLPRVLLHYDVHAGNYLTDGTLIDPRLRIGPLTADVSALTVDHRVSEIAPYTDYLAEQAYIAFTEDFGWKINKGQFMEEFCITRIINALMSLGSECVKPGTTSQTLSFYKEEAMKSSRKCNGDSLGEKIENYISKSMLHIA